MRAGSWAKTKSSDTEPAPLHRARPARRPGRRRCRRSWCRPRRPRAGSWSRSPLSATAVAPAAAARTAGLRPAPMTRLAPGSRSFCPVSSPAMPVAPGTITVLRDRPRLGGPQRQPRGAAWVDAPEICTGSAPPGKGQPRTRALPSARPGCHSPRCLPVHSPRRPRVVLAGGGHIGARRDRSGSQKLPNRIITFRHERPVWLTRPSRRSVWPKDPRRSSVQAHRKGDPASRSAMVSGGLTGLGWMPPGCQFHRG